MTVLSQLTGSQSWNRTRGSTTSQGWVRSVEKTAWLEIFKSKVHFLSGLETNPTQYKLFKTNGVLNDQNHRRGTDIFELNLGHVSLISQGISLVQAQWRSASANPCYESHIWNVLCMFFPWNTFNKHYS